MAEQAPHWLIVVVLVLQGVVALTALSALVYLWRLNRETQRILRERFPRG